MNGHILKTLVICLKRGSSNFRKYYCLKFIATIKKTTCHGSTAKLYNVYSRFHCILQLSDWINYIKHYLDIQMAPSSQEIDNASAPSQI